MPSLIRVVLEISKMGSVWKCRSWDTVTVHINPEQVFRRALVLVLEISKMGSVCIKKRPVPVDVQDLPYWFCALCHRRETMMLESDQLVSTILLHGPS
jgi:hypothetical protein